MDYRNSIGLENAVLDMSDLELQSQNAQNGTAGPSGSSNLGPPILGSSDRYTY